MPRLFTAANSEYFTTGSALIATLPIVMSCWFRASNLTAKHPLMEISTDDPGNDGYAMSLRGDVAGDPIEAYVVDAGVASSEPSTTIAYSVNTWQHALAVYASTTSRTIYINGGSSATDTTLVTPDAVDTTRVGRRSLFGDSFLDGAIARAAFINAVPTAAQIAALASGARPDRVMPGNIVAYYEGSEASGDLIDWSGNNNHLTDTNTVTASADGPPVTLWTPSWAGWSEIAAVAGGAGIRNPMTGPMALRNPVGAF